MRLLHVDELKVKEFNESNRPPYAILSHTWGDGEVSFQDIQTPKAVSMAGYAKVLKCCEIAKQDGFEYVWIDTCCIDKTSSSELSEAINSMYMWYRLASVCYAFLSDVQGEDNHHGNFSQFRRSRWFRRGWTLQELLAPEVLVFYNNDWVEIGTKRSLQEIISDITKIPCDPLLEAEHIPKTSIAARMSWAASRETTRVEDTAYCLMGIFDVDMPPLYGEGEKAFTRLQLEIIKHSDDESIFAWSSSTPHDTWCPGQNPVSFWDRHNLLAISPQSFQHCQGVMYSHAYQSRPPFSMSNKGLHTWLPCIRDHFSGGYEPDVFLVLAVLNCILADGRRIGILLQMQSGSTFFMRVYYAVAINAADLNGIGDPTELYIVDNPNDFTTDFQTRYQPKLTSIFSFIENASPETGYQLCYMYDAREVHTLNEAKPISRTSTFQGNDFQDRVDLNYLVVKSTKDPAIQAVIAMGMLNHGSLGTAEQHHRVFVGSEIPPELTEFTWKYDQRQAIYSKIFFSENNPTDRRKLAYFPNEKTVKHLGSNWVLTITVRTGPITYFGPRISHDYRVHIAFSRLS